MLNFNFIIEIMVLLAFYYYFCCCQILTNYQNEK